MRVLSRREALVSAGALSLATTANAAAPATVTPPPPPRVNLPASEQMMFSTVRLELATQAGTGFLFSFFDVNNHGHVAIVTNRHVFVDETTGELFDEGYFPITLAKPDGSPDIGNVDSVHMTNIKKALVAHPEADLAIYMISDVLNNLKAAGKAAYVTTISQENIPDGEQFKALYPLEDIVTVGFPGTFWDNVNVLPLFHSGRTATPANINFQGRQEFLVDTTTWPGASGSPVFLYNEGMFRDERSGQLMSGERALLIGVVWGVGRQELDGDVYLVNAPTSVVKTQNKAAISVPTNLGACIRSTRVLEFEPILAKMGVTVPDGYRMRAG